MVFYIGLGYDHIWQLILKLVVDEVWKYWLFRGNELILAMHNNKLKIELG